MNEPREVTDGEQLKWSCVQTSVTGESATVPVVCTPSGGATSVRLDLPADWMEGLAEADLLAAITQARTG